MTHDPDLSALAVLRVLATHAIDSGGGIGVHYTWTPDPARVHADAPMMAARAAFTEADRWAGRFRPGTTAAYAPPETAGGGWTVGPGGATNQTGADTARHLATGLRQDLAKRILTEAKEHGCAVADPDAAEHMVRLAEALGVHAPRLWEAAGMAAAPPADNEAAQACDPATGLLPADAALIRHLEGLGDIGKKQAGKLREIAEDPRQADFTCGPVPAAVRLWGLWLPFDAATVDAARQSPAMREHRLPDGAEPLPGATVDAEYLARARENRRGDYQRALLRTADAPALTPPSAWRVLCQSLWWDVVAPELRQEAAKRRAAAHGTVRGIRSGVAAGLAEIGPGGRLDKEASTDGQLVIRFRPSGTAMLETGLGLDLAPLLANLDALGQIGMLRALVAVAHHAAHDWQRMLAGDRNAGTLRWRIRSEREAARFVAEAWDDLDGDSMNGATRRLLVEAMEHGSAILLPNPTDPTLKPIRLWELEQIRKGKRVERLLTALGAMVPGDAFVDFAGDGKAQKNARRVVPLLRRMPAHEAFPGPVRAQAVSTMFLRALPEIRRRAWDYASQGLDCERIVRDAFDQSGIGEYAADAWHLWSTGGDADFAPFKASARRWTLNPEKHPGAHADLTKQGQQEKPARLRGGKTRKG